MKQIRFFLLLLFVAASAGSCVSNRQYKSLKNDYSRLLNDRSALNDRVNALSSENSALTRRLQELENMSESYRTLTAEHASLQQQFGELQTLMESYRRDRDREMGSLNVQLQHDRDALQTKEDELAERSRQLEQMQRELAERSLAVEQMQRELEQHHRRMAELEAILGKKDSVVNALRHRVSDALLGFEGKGLTVHIKNGKVYVSMDDKLLFKSGSYSIEPKGAEAIRELAKVLAQNPDINVVIEGHTDDVVYRSSGELKDNWDLSVKRATTVVRALLENTAIDPVRITAAGRSEYVPLETAKTADARQKNRRTEIILTPKLDELLEILAY
ncbi:MAG: OmpA family protein [Prevotellaceae bacterium]|jgi:chemotaxis protein MotB|nr:OmpA family protein [Prevotellaceae bacterium]